MVTPTLRAAEVAGAEVVTSAFSAAWLIHQHGFRWDADGHWTRVAVDRIDRAAVLMPGDELVVDEAGMLDQDTARALLTIADETGAHLVLLGDRHQLPAVGRGGVLDLALRWAPPEAVKELTTVHRFADPTYADLSLQMRSGEHSGEVFDALLERGEIVVHASEAEAIQSIAAARGLVLADTRDQVTALNAAIRDQRADDAGGGRDGEHRGGVFTTRAGEVIGVGDRVATRRNDRDLGVANRDTWTVTKVRADGTVAVRGRPGDRTLPSGYARAHVELAFATTVYGAQGETVDQAHLLVGETTGAAAAYVGMTRGRKANTAHLVADSVEDARTQWVEVFARDRADLGPAHAARVAAEDIDRYGPLARQRHAKSGMAALQAAALDGHGPRRPREPSPVQGLRPTGGSGSVSEVSLPPTVTQSTSAYLSDPERSSLPVLHKDPCRERARPRGIQSMPTMRTTFGGTPFDLRKRVARGDVPPRNREGVRPHGVRKRVRRFVTLRPRSVTEWRRHS